MNDSSINSFLSVGQNGFAEFTHASVFSGFGGFDLAAEWMGWTNVFNCEKNPFCQRLLKYYWPNTIQYGDIKQKDFSIHRRTIKLLTGGFPCQPFSLSGEQKGENDERYLFPEMLRAIREIEAPWILAENVYGLTTKKFRELFETICSSLEAEGYEVQPVIVPASSIGATHERYRVWIVAYSSSFDSNLSIQQRRQNQAENFNIDRQTESGIITDTDSHGLQKRISSGFESFQSQTKTFAGSKFTREFTEEYWEKFPTQSPICSGNDGLSDRLDGITFPNWRKESISGFGNAVVPQLVYQFYRSIQIADRQKRGEKTINTVNYAQI
jgi:DNA (cytosine-5)-methyltransferase 1